MEHAANISGQNEYAVAEIFTLCLEAVTDAVARGEEVFIPGFGIFGPMVGKSRGTVYPAFFGSAQFSAYVHASCSRSAAEFLNMRKYYSSRLFSTYAGRDGVKRQQVNSVLPHVITQRFRSQMGKARKLGLV